MIRVFCCASALVLTCYWAAADQPPEAIDLSKMAPEEVENLPKETLYALPAKDVFLQFGSFKSENDYLFMVKLALYSKMYAFGDASVRDQLRDFQKDIDVPVTGYLTVRQAAELFKGVSVVPVAKRVYPSGYAAPYIHGDYAEVEGTWVIEGEEIAYPINGSHIACYKELALCINNQVDVKTHAMGSAGLSLEDSYHLFSDVVEFAISDWSETEIVSRYDGRCRYTIMRINAATKEVTQITHNSGGECLLSLQPLKAPRVAILRPGFDTATEYFNRVDELAKDQWSQVFRKQYEEFVDRQHP